MGFHWFVVDLAQLVELFAEELRRRLYLGSSNTQIATALMHVIFFCFEGDRDALFHVKMGRLRELKSKCQPAPAHTPAHTPVAPVSAKSDALSGESWAVALPKKLSASTVLQLKEEFKQSYPAEVIDRSVSPDIRVLSMVMQQFHDKAFRWIPFHQRLNEAQFEDWENSRTSRPRSAELSLSTLFWEDLPISEEIRWTRIPLLMQVYANALAMCKVCHLYYVKLLHSKMWNMATKKYPQGAGLRAPNMQEVEEADRLIWTEVFALAAEKNGDMNSAIHEMATARSEVFSFLGARPVSLPVSKAAGKAKSRPANVKKTIWKPQKGKGRSSQGSPKGKSPAKDVGKGARHEWVLRIGNECICMRFQRKECTSPSCQYKHVCAVKTASGEACGMNHAAADHDSASR